MSFEDLGLIEPISRALVALNYESPTPIQEQAIPVVLEGRDLLGSAQTGTGKTAAFAIPIIQRLHNDKLGPFPKGEYPVRAVVIVPTRELAIQVGDSFQNYGKHTSVRRAVIYGGVHQRTQTKALKGKIDVIVATPGRLLDLMTQGHVKLGNVEYLVLDEADRMLDMGFIDDINIVLKAMPEKRQTLFFSATMPKSIVALTKKILTDPVKVAIDPGLSPAETVKQVLYLVGRRKKTELLIDLVKEKKIGSALVFSRTRHGADNITKELREAGIKSQVIHGERSQRDRQRALQMFKDDKCQVLVATEIAARGIDIDDLTHVVNYDMPETVEAYVHRIGRTGRAGLEGTAISFCDTHEAPLLWRIQRELKKTLEIEGDHPYALAIGQFAEPGSGKNRKPNYAGKGKWKKRPASSGPRKKYKKNSGSSSGGRPKRPTAAGKPKGKAETAGERKTKKKTGATKKRYGASRDESGPKKTYGKSTDDARPKKKYGKSSDDQRPKKKGAPKEGAAKKRATEKPKRQGEKSTTDPAKSTPKSKKKHADRKNKSKGAPGSHKKKTTKAAAPAKPKAKPSSKKARKKKAAAKKKGAVKKAKKKK